eukprot:718225_1
MAEERLSYSSNDLNSMNTNSLPPKPQLKPANKSTSHLEINNFQNHHNNKKNNINPTMRISKPKFHSGKHISKPPSLQLTGYPSADSSTGGQTGSRGPSPTHNNSNLNEKKVIYKFKSGETFVSFPYLIPQKIIGEGSYACVSSAIDTRSKKKYAIKKKNIPKET